MTRPERSAKGHDLIDKASIVHLPRAESVMIIAAHPDDMESWCAGTVVGAVAAGATARLLLVTSGDKGTDDPAVTSADVGALREQEARRATDLLGITEVVFLRHPDGEVEATRELRRNLVEWIWRPQAMFTHDPEHPLPPYLSHRDHRIVGRAALDAIYPLTRDRLTFPEHAIAGLLPHAVSEAWLFGPCGPQCLRIALLELGGHPGWPICVKNPRFIDPLVGVRSKVVAQCLNQVCRESLLPVTIDVIERGAESRARIDPDARARDPNAPSIAMAFVLLPDQTAIPAVRTIIATMNVATWRLNIDLACELLLTFRQA